MTSFDIPGMKPILLGLALGLGAVGLSGCTEEKKAEAEAPVVRPVKVVEIVRAGERTLTYSGSVKSRTEMNLGFRVAGKVTERRVNIGDRVKKGDVLARLDPTDYRLAVQSAEASLDAAVKAVETARLTRERARTLLAKNTVPQSQLDQAELSYNQAVASRAAAAAALDQARNQLAYADLASDRDGIVSVVGAEPGQVVAAGTPVVTVVADDEKEIKIAVPETEIGNFQAGKTVTARFWADEALSLEGKVREVSASADPLSRTFQVRVSLPADDKVLIGMTATVEARLGREAEGYSVPLTALAEKDGGKIVWTVDASKATVHARPVEVSGFTGDGVSVTEGLKPGDLVVAAGTQFMRENLTVKLPDIGALAQNLVQ
jgi:RND family efflux transporter MFP subunit